MFSCGTPNERYLHENIKLLTRIRRVVTIIGRRLRPGRRLQGDGTGHGDRVSDGRTRRLGPETTVTLMITIVHGYYYYYHCCRSEAACRVHRKRIGCV